MSEPTPRGEDPSEPDATFPWPADVGREASRVVAECRAEAARRWGVHASPAVVRRMAMRVATAAVDRPGPLPPWREALAKVCGGLMHREGPVDRLRLVLACRPGAWPDLGKRRDFLAEFARSVDASLGR